MDQISPIVAENLAHEVDRIAADIVAVINALYGVYPHPLNIAWILGARSQEEVIRNSMKLLRAERLIDGPDAAASLTENGYQSFAVPINSTLGKASDYSAARDFLEMSDPGKQILNLLNAFFDNLKP